MARARGARRAKGASVTRHSPRLRWRGALERAFWTGCSLGVILYSVWVLSHVAWMGTIGVRCMFGTKVEEEIPADYAWDDARPQKGDELLSIGGAAHLGERLRRLCGLHPGDARADAADRPDDRGPMAGP